MTADALDLPDVTRSFHVRTFGCQMNEHDSARIASMFEADGMVACDAAEDADVIVLNTCCIRENADNKFYGHLGMLKALKDERPDMQIAVAGCLAQKDRDMIIGRAPWVDAVWGTHNAERALDLLGQARASGRPVCEIIETPDTGSEPPPALPVRRDSQHSAWVTIQVGCDNNCAFCIVPSVRGREASKPFAAIVGEVAAMAANGTVEVTLLGQNVNSYGRDITTSLRADDAWRDKAAAAGSAWVRDERPRARPLFADLLRAVASVDGIRRVRYTSPHPKDLRADTIEVMATEKAVCSHLHLPLQSGSDRVLAAMHRGYTSERYLAKLASARSTVDDLAVTTDIIVGFPGETDRDFEATLEVVAEAAFDSAYTFIYSPRPGTESAAWVDRFVAPDVIAERFERLRAVVERSALARHQARVGLTEEVLVEGVSKRRSDMVSGRSSQGKLIHFAADPTALPAGSWVDVLVTRGAPHHLEGELVAVTGTPRKRQLIPVVAA